MGQVCDTRGSVVRKPSSPDADVVEIEDGDRYSKEEFMTVIMIILNNLE